MAMQSPSWETSVVRVICTLCRHVLRWTPQEISNLFFPSSIPLFRYGGVHKWGTQNTWFISGKILTCMIWGYPYGLEPPISWISPKRKRKNALPAIGTPCAPATLSRLDRPSRCPRGVAVGSYPGSKGGGEQTSKIFWLVVDLPLWKIWVSWDDYSQCMGKQKMFQATNQCLAWTGLFRTGTTWKHHQKTTECGKNVVLTSKIDCFQPPQQSDMTQKWDPSKSRVCWRIRRRIPDFFWSHGKPITRSNSFCWSFSLSHHGNLMGISTCAAPWLPQRRHEYLGLPGSPLPLYSQLGYVFWVFNEFHICQVVTARYHSFLSWHQHAISSNVLPIHSPVGLDSHQK